MTLHYTDAGVTLHHGNCLDVLAELPDESVDAIVTDPPYGLANTDPTHVADTIVRWVNGDREYIPEGKGFMGASWDAFVPPVAVWDECLRVLKPGGHVLAFAGSRTVDLMTLGLRLAGFDIRDSIAWLYGSGFPKSLDVSKAIDKLDASAARLARAREFQSWLRQHVTPQQVNAATGTDMGHHYTTHPTQPAVATVAHLDMLRQLLPEVPEWVEAMCSQRTVESENYARRPITQAEVRPLHSGEHITFDQRSSKERERRDIPATADAARWEGWGTALKPAFEPIVVARKPLAGTVAANVLAHGTGALNIDGCRIGSEERVTRGMSSLGVMHDDDWQARDIGAATVTGRWPANVVLDEGQAAALDQQSGITSDRPHRRNAPKDAGTYGAFTGADPDRLGHADSGGASRFFYVAKAPKKERPSYFRPTCECEDAWPTHTPSAARATDETTAPGSSSTSNPGSATTDAESLTDTRSTTSTATNSTTRPTTFSPSPLPTTSASTPDANCGTGSGGSPAASVASSSPLASPTGISVAKGGPSTDVAAPATSHEWSETSVCGNCGEPTRRESHATVKPLALMRWLVRLVTPPGGTVLDPFAGSGATAEACMQEGFDTIAIEREPDYLPLILQRIHRNTTTPDNDDQGDLLDLLGEGEIA